MLLKESSELFKMEREVERLGLREEEETLIGEVDEDGT